MVNFDAKIALIFDPCKLYHYKITHPVKARKTIELLINVKSKSFSLLLFGGVKIKYYLCDVLELKGFYTKSNQPLKAKI